MDGKGAANNATLYGFRLLDSEVSYTVTTDYIKFNEIKLYDRDSYLGKGTGIVGFLGNMDYKFNIYPKALRLSKLLDILAVDFTAVDGHDDKRRNRSRRSIRALWHEGIRSNKFVFF